MIIKHHSPAVPEVDGEDPGAIQVDLSAAMEIVSCMATQRGHGTLVTQHDYWSFTVAVSPDVPHGQTWERRQWR
ncbi:hypothetical protein [Arthrobacter oryzae]|jgi:hypothetical protein|uniref:hypothetical protein n=1 Tax=Arthrobacter oryzae TaxID=409290 RepID=UPI00278B74F1|nr:hypothetical protein [Arthrobacter oryzae]MDQ0079530.1 hypothetical protein [Arthrobacter oryzae]